MEARVRITFFLPISTTNDRAAFLRVLDALRTRHPPGAPSPSENSLITGLTYSADDPPAFHGNWWSESRSEWVPDRLVLLLVDRRGSLRRPRAFLTFAESLKAQIAQVYADEGSPQEEIWCILEQIHRVP